MIWELLLFIGLVMVLIALLVWIRRQERKRLHQRTREAISPKLRQEFEQEREAEEGRKRKFEEAMKLSETK